MLMPCCSPPLICNDPCAGDAGLTFVEGNAERLPFEDNSRDSYTIAFGIRNVTDRDAALAEALRILRPGGRFMCLEFSQVGAQDCWASCAACLLLMSAACAALVGWPDSADALVEVHEHRRGHICCFWLMILPALAAPRIRVVRLQRVGLDGCQPGCRRGTSPVLRHAGHTWIQDAGP